MNGDVPDRHPEAFCDQCGRRNLHWWTDSELWNVALGSEREKVLCPSCFTAAWTAATGRDVVWVLRPDSRTAATADDLEEFAPAAVAQVRVRALEEAADAWQHGQWADAPRRPDRVVERIANAQYVGDWLRNRAARVAQPLRDRAEAEGGDR